MTIAIGFACQDGIIVASDSQMSSGDKFKRYDEPKVFHIPFNVFVKLSGEDKQTKIPWGVAVAISGSLDGANYFREILEDKIRSIESVTHTRDIADAVSDSAKQTRDRILAIVGHEESLKKDRDDLLGALDFSAVIAFYFNSRPQIYTVALWNCLAVKSNREFELIGCGEDVASLVLTDAKVRQMDMSKALPLTVFAVEMCKRFDQRCGGKFQHRVILKNTSPYPIHFTEDTIEKYANASGQAHGAMIDGLLESMKDLASKEVLKKAEDGLWKPTEPSTPPVSPVSPPSSGQRLSSPKTGRKRRPASQE